MLAMVRAHVLPAAFAVLPAPMRSASAERMLLAIGWQESRFRHRKQIGGPARGFWQFELGGGVHGVLAHSQTKDLIREALKTLAYPHAPTPLGCHQAIEHNDVLAAVFARLYLWTSPRTLPVSESEAWAEYLAVWRPGKPHEATWSEAWQMAATVTA